MQPFVAVASRGWVGLGVKRFAPKLSVAGELAVNENINGIARSDRRGFSLLFRKKVLR